MNTMHTAKTHSQHMDDHLEPRQPAQLPVGMTEDSPTDGDLIGNPPITFEGDRSKTDWFITQFDLFRIINERNTVITNPKRRVALALTYIRGPKVDPWVAQQRDALLIKANHARTYADTDEALWEDFIAEFKRAFAEPLWQVFARLENLRMAGDEVELYIATFNNLMRRTGFQGGPMVPYFRQGLPINLVRSIMKRQTMPNTIDEWQSAARKEVESQALIKLYLPARPEGGDTDALSEEEITRFMTEGRCFKCSRKGHRARECLET
jgi:hypothetical protein